MSAQLHQGPAEPRAVGAKKLNNGGVMYELNEPETASWVRKEKVAFMASFGSSAIMRDRAISVLVEFLPVAHSLDALAEDRRIECESGLEEGGLMSTRWIKPEQRCATGQKAAHLIARFRTHEAANSAIKEGLVISGKRVWARQMGKEPRRCLNCQSLTIRHLAARCNQQAACGTCGKDHQMAECLKTNRDTFWCVSCNSSGHTSWDRLCPAFLAASSCMENSDPKYFYKYFPDREAWTWEQQPGHGDFDVTSQ